MSASITRLVMAMALVAQAWVIASQTRDLRRSIDANAKLLEATRQLQAADEGLKEADRQLKATCNSVIIWRGSVNAK